MTPRSHTAPIEISLSELARRLGCNESTVKQYIADGMPHRRPRRNWKFVLGDVMEWLRTNGIENGERERAAHAPRKPALMSREAYWNQEHLQ